MSQSPISSQVIEQLFKACFFDDYQTLLIGGADEPLYQPNASAQGEHHIYYRADYVSSALHEVAHWCLAGESRLVLEDYGYWYIPEAERTIEQQQKFMQVEAKPQALEKVFSEALGIDFKPSLDSFICDHIVEEMFQELIQKEYSNFFEQPFSERSFRFFNALQRFD